MSRQAFFSTNGSNAISQSQLLENGINSSTITSIQFQNSSTSPSLIYQPSNTPTFYTTTESPFNNSNAFIQTSSGARKEYQISGDMRSDDNQIIYEQFFVDVQDASTSQVIDESNVVVDIDDSTHQQSQIVGDKYETKVVVDGDEDNEISSDENESLQMKRMKQSNLRNKRRYKDGKGTKRDVQSQNRKGEQNKEVEELESLLRKTKDIDDDVNITKELKEKRMRARRAEAARMRYQRMSSEERREYNQRRRLRQLGIQGSKKNGPIDDEAIRQRIQQQNAKKAEAARLRYHRMSEEERKLYNQRRTEAFRRRRIEEEILLSTPAGRISAEALNKAQQIMMRNAKRAEAARLRYRRMTPEQRKAYNLRRSLAKKERENGLRTTPNSSMSMHSDGSELLQLTPIGSDHGGFVVQENAIPTEEQVVNITKTSEDSSNLSEEALNALERDVVRRTKQANMVLMKQRRFANVPEQLIVVATAPDGTQTVIPSTTTEDGKQIFHIPSHISHLSPIQTATSLCSTSESSELIAADVKHHSVRRFSMQTPPNTSVVMSSSEPSQLTNLISSAQQPQLTSTPVDKTQLIITDVNNQQQLTQLSPVQHSPTIIVDDNLPVDTSITTSTSTLNSSPSSSNTSQSHIIVAVHDDAHLQNQAQIILTDLNQPTGLVLSTVSNHIRSRNRQHPLLTGNTVGTLLQQHQQQENNQPQQTIVMLPEQIPLSSTASSSAVRCIGDEQQSVIDTSSERQIASRMIITTSRSANDDDNADNDDSKNSQDILAAATAASVGCISDNSDLTPQQQKLLIQRAKRAARARMRYHNMSEEERRKFNAKRASALRKARIRDEQLCQLAETVGIHGGALDENIKQQIEEAQNRRAKRALAARLKYHRMSSEERRQYNAMRDAQRRQRKRAQMNATAMQQCEQEQLESARTVHDSVGSDADPQQDHSLMYGSYISFEEPVEQSWSE